MKYRLTEDLPMLEYKKGHVFDGNPVFKTRYENVTWNEEVNPVELSLLLKTGILEEVKGEEWPKEEDYYWFVEDGGDVDRTMFLSGSETDAKRKGFGNVFHSETAAKEASEKIKTLLLSLKK